MSEESDYVDSSAATVVLARCELAGELTNAVWGSGARVGDARLEECVSEGMLFQSWSARRGRERCFVKFPRSLSVLYPQACSILRREYEALRVMNEVSDGVPRLLDADVYDERPYIMSEFINGASVQDLMIARRDSFDSIELCERVLRILDEVHAQDLLHLDVKPRNVMVSNERKVYLVDFDCARSPASTIGMEVRGSPPYMAPEQCPVAEEGLDARADVFAVAKMLNELVTSEHLVPDRSRNMAHVIGFYRGAARDRLYARVEAADDRLTAFSYDLNKSIEFDRERRHQSACEFADALSSVLDFARARGWHRRQYR